MKWNLILTDFDAHAIIIYYLNFEDFQGQQPTYRQKYLNHLAQK